MLQTIITEIQEMLNDDRPITPDMDYLAAAANAKNKAIPTSYLRRKAVQLLPCYVKKTSVEKVSRQRDKTKAQIYEQIKQNNRKKFGERKDTVALEAQQKPKRKIQPKDMTVHYKAKPITKANPNQNTQSVIETKIIAIEPSQSKQEKVLELYRQQLVKLQAGKTDSQELPQKIKFKQYLKQADGLPISKCKQNIDSLIIRSVLSPPKSAVIVGSKEKGSILSAINLDVRKAKPIDCEMIRHEMNKAQSVIKQLKRQVIRIAISQQNSNKLTAVHQLSHFTIDSIAQNISFENLRYDTNQFYRQATQVLKSRCQQATIHSQNNMVNEPDSKLDLPSKRVGDKRVIKYPNGWIEVWIPGKQRLMALQGKYKVVWLGNGDVKQQFQHGLWTYYSAQKHINQINLNNLQPINYHQKHKQLSQLLANGQKQVLLQNGRRELIHLS